MADAHLQVGSVAIFSKISPNIASFRAETTKASELRAKAIDTAMRHLRGILRRMINGTG